MRIWFPNDADGSIDLEDRSMQAIGISITLIIPIPSYPEIPPNYTDYLRKFLGDTLITQSGTLQQQSTMSPQTISGLNLNYLRKFLGDS